MVSSAAAMETAGQAQTVVPDGSRAALVPAMPATTTTGGAAREPEGLPCPRCESINTKFCYYNNYNLAQPRHFCRTCRRYWTRGGALRNVPVGGGTRKAVPAAAAGGVRRKRAAAAAPAAPTSATASPASALLAPPPAAPLHGCSLLRPYVSGGGVGGGMSFGASAALASPPLTAVDPAGRLLDLGGSFTSLIAPGAADVGVHFSTAFLLAGGLSPAAMPRAPVSFGAALPPPTSPPTQQQQQQHPTVSQALPEGVFWSMGWPDLSI